MAEKRFKYHPSQFKERIMIGGIPHPDVRPTHKILGSLANYMNLRLSGVGEALDEAVIGDCVDVPDELIREVVENTNKRYEESLNLPPTNAFILTGSTSCIDRLSHFKNSEDASQRIKEAFEVAVKDDFALNGRSREENIEIIEHIISEDDINNLPKNIRTKTEVIGFILRTFKHPGGRIQIVDFEEKKGTGKQLGEWIEEIFKCDEEKGGGAALQVGDFLAGIGEKNVTIHSLSRSPTQISVLKNKPSLLDSSNDQINILDKKSVLRNDDPTKINQIIELSAGITVEFNGKPIKAKKEADRYIFLSQNYDTNGEVIDLDPTLQFNDKELEAIGDKFKFFFTTAPSYLQRYNAPEYDKHANRLAYQFKILKNKGVKILYEFSGNTSKNVRFLKDVVKGNISSFSLNDQELENLIEAINRDDGLGIKVKKGKDPLTVYNNALILAWYLEADRLHVHGHNIDISIRKNATDEDMKREQSAVMHAKQRVTEWIRGKKSIEKTPKKEQLSKLLKREGFIDFLKFSEQLAQQTYPKYNENTYMQRARLKYKLRNNGYYRIDDEYSVSVVPTKWIYDEALVTTSSGDIMAIIAAVQAL